MRFDFLMPKDIIYNKWNLLKRNSSKKEKGNFCPKIDKENDIGGERGREA